MLQLLQNPKNKSSAQCSPGFHKSAAENHTLGLCALLPICLLFTACQSAAPEVASDWAMPNAPMSADTDIGQNVPLLDSDGTTTKQLVGSMSPAEASDHLYIPESSLTEYPTSHWQEQIHESFEYARALVEAELDVELDNVQLMLVNDSPINQEVAIETRRLVQKQFGQSAFADQFLNQVMQTQAGTYAALFAARLNSIMVSRSMLMNFEQSLPADPEVHDAALLTLLIHELVHAADNKRYKIHDKRALSFRASFAQSATFEGHAQWVTRKICNQIGCSTGLDALDHFMFSRDESSNQLTQAVEAISRNVLEYSYVEGERFIDELSKRDNGYSIISSILSSPPHDPVQILAPASFPDLARDQRNDRLIEASRHIDHPWLTNPWVGVETSPLKGINLRADPTRRQAAIDGFTRLIQGMVAIQFYNQTSIKLPPIEVTLLHAESDHTARLFANTLHQNTLQADSFAGGGPRSINLPTAHNRHDLIMHLYQSAIDTGDGAPYRTAIGVSGPYVVQIAGNADEFSTFEDYARGVLLDLQYSQEQHALQR